MSRDKWKEIQSPTTGCKAFEKGECRVLVSRLPMSGVAGFGFLRWHLSISCARRYPTWEEIKDARYSLLPDQCTMAMLLPPRAEYVNLHPNCFHLHEILDK
jgi:hypothetical protein